MLATDALVAGRYRLGPVIGRGGVADVYRADDLATDEPVAVKVLRPATTSDLRRFEREGRALERLRHPAIVRMRDEGEQDGVPFLVLDLIDGEPLAQVLERGALAEDDVAVMGSSLASALAHAHGLGIVHRDVKPGNVLIDRRGAAFLTDFGIARLVDTAAITAITETGMVIGTAAYLAPEQVRGERVGPEADVYSLGLVLLEAITGERVYRGAPAQSALARLERGPQIPPLTPWLASTLSAMTALPPARRPRAEAVAEAFGHRAVAGDRTVALPVVSESTAVMSLPSRRRSGLGARGRVLAALSAAVLVAAIVLFAVSRDATSNPPAGADTGTTSSAEVTVAPTSVAPVASPPSTNTRKAPPRKGDGNDKGPGAGPGHGDGGGG